MSTHHNLYKSEKRQPNNMEIRGRIPQLTNTALNTVTSPNLLMWKFCGKTQFPHSFE